jgi:hypothetical protein
MVNEKRNPHQQRHYRAMDAVVTEAVTHMMAYLEDLSDAQLEQAHKTVEGLSTTNCGWTIYQARPLLKELIWCESRKRLKTQKEAV